VVRPDSRTGGGRLDTLRWGLVPYWGKDIKIGYSLINAKAETVAEKPSYRDAFKERRCIIPGSASTSGLKLVAGTKRPYAIVVKDRGASRGAGFTADLWASPAPREAALARLEKFDVQSDLLTKSA